MHCSCIAVRPLILHIAVLPNRNSSRLVMLVGLRLMAYSVLEVLHLAMTAVEEVRDCRDDQCADANAHTTTSLRPCG